MSYRGMNYARAIRRAIIIAGVSIAFASIMATAVFFPWNVDPQGDESKNSRDFYAKVYNTEQAFSNTGDASGSVPLSTQEQFYINVAQKSAREAGIPEMIADFVKEFDLKDKKVLEVGAGSGLLQDFVTDYVGLDISPKARRFFHKPFVEASATNMPFPDNSFGALWSVWVLEHIPNPEQALLEMRRVVKPQGVILLRPALDVSRYAAQGYRVRPYSDFGWLGKLIKATMPITESWLFNRLHLNQVRALRALAGRVGIGPSRLHFVKLTPNYDEYWVPDSDATTSVSFHELYQWFATRGDRCVNCPSEYAMLIHSLPAQYLIIRVQK